MNTILVKFKRQKWLENGPTPTEISPNKKVFKRRKLILDKQEP
jgi:hypothetical protein